MPLELQPPAVRTTHRPLPALLAGLGVLALATTTMYFLSGTIHYIRDYSAGSYGHFWGKQPWIQIHLLSGVCATLVGPFQFWSGLRRRSLSAHRWAGRLYLTGILAAGAAAFYLAATAPGGPDRRAALASMAATWWLVTGMAYLAIAKRAITQHREWMVRSYAVTFGGFSFSRLLERVAVWFHPTLLEDMELALTVDAAILWLSFIAPLLVTEVILQGRKILAYRPA